MRYLTDHGVDRYLFAKMPTWAQNRETPIAADNNTQVSKGKYTNGCKMNIQVTWDQPGKGRQYALAEWVPSCISGDPL